LMPAWRAPRQSGADLAPALRTDLPGHRRGRGGLTLSGCRGTLPAPPCTLRNRGPHRRLRQGQCAADARCTAADPNLKNRAWALWVKLDAELQKLQSCDSAEDHRRPINVAHSGLLCAFVQKCQPRHVATTRRAELKQTDYRQGKPQPRKVEALDTGFHGNSNESALAQIYPAPASAGVTAYSAPS
jgi:hypothetical protein